MLPRMIDLMLRRLSAAAAKEAPSEVKNDVQGDSKGDGKAARADDVLFGASVSFSAIEMYLGKPRDLLEFKTWEQLGDREDEYKYADAVALSFDPSSFLA